VAIHDLTPQLRTRLRRMEKVVGLFVVVAALTLLAGFGFYLYRTAERKGWFTPKCPYYTFVQSADGLNVGDPVLLMGFSVGEITVIDAEPPNSTYNVYLGFEIKQPYYGYVWSDSKARITAGSLLGGRQLEVTKGRTGQPTAYEADGRVAEVWVDGRRIPLEEQKQGPFLVPEEAPALAARAEVLVGKLEEELPPLVKRADALLANVEQLTSHLDELVVGAKPVVGNLDAITKNLRNPKGSLGEWILTPELRRQLETTLGSVDANLTVLSGTLRNVDAITGSVRTQLDANRDVLGDVSDLVRDTDALVQGLKRHWLLRSAFPVPPADAGSVPLEPLPGPPGPGAP
jgi:ABC-type transporter Mla subunit MlaD